MATSRRARSTHHVSAILRKLDVQSRGEAVAELKAAFARSIEEGERTPDDDRRVCSYVLAETSGAQIVSVADTVVVQPGPQPVRA